MVPLLFHSEGPRLKMGECCSIRLDIVRAFKLRISEFCSLKYTCIEILFLCSVICESAILQTSNKHFFFKTQNIPLLDINYCWLCICPIQSVRHVKKHSSQWFATRLSFVPWTVNGFVLQKEQQQFSIDILLEYYPLQLAFAAINLVGKQ